MNLALSKYAYILQKVYWFAYLQALWTLFTICGLVLFGIFPATHALFTVLKESNELSSGKVFHLFRKTFTSSFIQINKAAVIWQVMVLLIGLNLIIIPSDYLFFKLMDMGMLGLILLSILHFFQYFELERPIILQIKRAFSLVFLYPKENAGYMFIFVLLLIAITFFPGLTLFFGMSISLYFVVKLGNYKQKE